MNRSIRILAMAAAVLAGAAALSAIAIVLWPRGGEVAVAPSAVGGPFKLTDQNGRAVTDADLKGKPFLVFFGFTNCPDVCPTALFDMSEVFRRLGPDAEKVSAIFISVDPARDTPEKMKDYLQSFHERISALTGTQADIDAVTKAYKAYAKRVPLENGDYTMDHSAIVYLMDKNGRFVGSFNLNRPPAEAAQELLRHL
jgi:protein SCO1/2